MPKATKLPEYVRRSGKSVNLQYRRRVPLDVQKAHGKVWVERSLNTADPREAKKRAALISAELEQQWTTLRGEASPLHQWRQGAAWLAQQEPLEFTGEPEDPDHFYASDAFDKVEAFAKGDGKAPKLPEGATSDAYVAWLRGEHKLPSPRLTMRDAFKVWVDERKPSAAIEQAASRIVEQFSTIARNAPLGEITRAQARQYRDSLVASATAPGSIETYISYLRTIYENAIREQLIEDHVNPFAALRIERGVAAEEERAPIPREACLSILKTSLAHGFDQSDWYAAAMLVSGARPGGLFKAKLVLGVPAPYWSIPREKKSPPRVVTVHPMLIAALNGNEPPKYTVRVEQLRRQFIERHAPYTAYQCRHSFNDEARRVGMPMELRLRIMGHSARKIIGENARYGSVEAVLEDAPTWIEKMWQ